jgi:hypothetical protein
MSRNGGIEIHFCDSYSGSGALKSPMSDKRRYIVMHVRARKDGSRRRPQRVRLSRPYRRETL